MLRIVLAVLLFAMAGTAALAASPDQGPAVDMLQTPDEAYASALRQAIGAPARADLGDQATARLAENQLIVPKDAAARLLVIADRPVPPDFVGLLLGAEGIQAAGTIRFVPGGFVDADAALAWTQDDMLASLNDTVQHANPARITAGKEAREARRWISAPRYSPEAHQLSWAALIVPKSAPRESDGEVTYRAIGFGREGYIEVSVVSSVQKADEVGRMLDLFLSGLNFLPGRTYGDVQPGDQRSSAGLAGAMGIDSLHKLENDTSFWASDLVVPIAGSVVAGIGALALLLYIYKHMRRQSRRV